MDAKKWQRKLKTGEQEDGKVERERNTEDYWSHYKLAYHHPHHHHSAERAPIESFHRELPSLLKMGQGIRSRRNSFRAWRRRNQYLPHIHFYEQINDLLG